MKTWREAKNAAYNAIDQSPKEKEFIMRGSDIDPAAVEAAKLNADTAGVAEDIMIMEIFRVQITVQQYRTSGKKRCISAGVPKG